VRCLSGVFGGQNVLFGKMVAVLLGMSFSGNNQFGNPFTWLFLVCMFVSIFSQLHWMAVALSYFDALYVVPVFQCFFITVTTVGGGAFFLEFEKFSVVAWILFPLGILVTLLGVRLLSLRNVSEGADRAGEIRKMRLADEEAAAHPRPSALHRQKGARSSPPRPPASFPILAAREGAVDASSPLSFLIDLGS